LIENYSLVLKTEIYIKRIKKSYKKIYQKKVFIFGNVEGFLFLIKNSLRIFSSLAIGTKI
jgi:hypothetical protein